MADQVAISTAGEMAEMNFVGVGGLIVLNAQGLAFTLANSWTHAMLDRDIEVRCRRERKYTMHVTTCGHTRSQVTEHSAKISS